MSYVPRPCAGAIILSRCADITQSGVYSLDRDLSGSVGEACLRIHDVTDVHLDCAGHAVTTGDGLAAVVVETVKHFTIRACSLPQLSGYSLLVGNSTDGIITKNTIKKLVVNTPDSEVASLHVVGNRFSEFGGEDPATHPFVEEDTQIIPLPPGLNWIDARNLAVPTVTDSALNAGTVLPRASVRVYPNPWRAAGPTLVTFDQLPSGATIKIFTVSAHWIRTLMPSGNSVQWDLRNDAGENVASGHYLYTVLTPDGQKTVGQLAVIR